MVLRMMTHQQLANLLNLGRLIGFFRLLLQPSRQCLRNGTKNLPGLGLFLLTDSNFSLLLRDFSNSLKKIFLLHPFRFCFHWLLLLTFKGFWVFPEHFFSLNHEFRRSFGSIDRSPNFLLLLLRRMLSQINRNRISFISIQFDFIFQTGTISLIKLLENILIALIQALYHLIGLQRHHLNNLMHLLLIRQHQPATLLLILLGKYKFERF